MPLLIVSTNVDAPAERKQQLASDITKLLVSELKVGFSWPLLQPLLAALDTAVSLQHPLCRPLPRTAMYTYKMDSL